MVKIARFFCVCFCLSATYVNAQTGPPALAQSSVSAEDFRRLALMGESFDLEAARLAAAKATRRSIRAYANFIIGNFRLNYGRLSASAGFFSGIPALPGDPNAPVTAFLDARRQTMLNQLETAEGWRFDRLYLDIEWGMRREMIALYQTFLQTGADAQLIAYAQQRLPTLQQEENTIRRLAGRRR